MSIAIKKGIPPPKRRQAGGRPCDYPFDEMKPGMCLEVLPRGDETLRECAKRLRTAAASWRHRRGPLLSFIVRDKDDDSGMPYLNGDGHLIVRMWAVKPEDSTSPANRALKKKRKAA